MSRNTSVSRNGAGSAAIAARSCSASILARSVVSGVRVSGSPGLACASSTASRSSTVTTAADGSCAARNKRCCARCSAATRGHCRRRNLGWHGMRATTHPAPRLRHQCYCPSANAPADRRRRYAASQRSRSARCRRGHLVQSARGRGGQTQYGFSDFIAPTFCTSLVCQFHGGAVGNALLCLCSDELRPRGRSCVHSVAATGQL